MLGGKPICVLICAALAFPTLATGTRGGEHGEPGSACSGASLSAEVSRKTRVIVTLAVEWSPEPTLSRAERTAQRVRIKAAQTRLLRRLATFHPSGVVRYAATPQLALALNADGLRYLERSPLVHRVQANTPENAA